MSQGERKNLKLPPKVGTRIMIDLTSGQRWLITQLSKTNKLTPKQVSKRLFTRVCNEVAKEFADKMNQLTDAKVQEAIEELEPNTNLDNGTPQEGE